jgi:dTDP-4-dehydrorhamnose 3,5-epimerase-like enzyme
MLPKVIQGNHFSDERGALVYNNEFDASLVKRIYFIENKNVDFIRAWQGHKIEQRWFTAVRGSFLIRIIAIDNWESPSVFLVKERFVLSPDNFLVLHIPKGYVSSIQSLEENAKLMVMGDYHLGAVQDEFRFEAQYFK